MLDVVREMKSERIIRANARGNLGRQYFSGAHVFLCLGRECSPHHLRVARACSLARYLIDSNVPLFSNIVASSEVEGSFHAQPYQQKQTSRLA